MKNKRAQFYIIAALLIIVAISGLMTISTYAIANEEPQDFELISSGLNIEGSKIVDFGILNNSNPQDIIEDFTKNKFAPYFLQKTENANLLFIYGNKESLYGIRYKPEITGTISASIGGQANWFMTNPYSEKINLNVYPSDSYVKVNLLNSAYQFELRDNEMFYFLLAQEKDGEIYVEKN